MIIKIQNRDIINAIKYWESISPYYKKVFDNKSIEGLIVIADLVTKKKVIDSNIIEDFISGIAFIGISYNEEENIKREENIIWAEKLVKPMITEIIDHIESKEFQDFVWNDDFERVKELHKSFINPSNKVLPGRRIEEVTQSLFDNLKSQIKDTDIFTLSGFDASISQKNADKLYDVIVGDYIHSNTSKRCFKYLFSTKSISDFEPVIWIKKATRGKTLNKKALIDLLDLAGVDTNKLDLVKLNKLFAKQKDVPIDIKSANIYNNKSKNNQSEYYEDLENIFSKL